MAKPRKQKNEDQKPDNSEAVVRHQKLCLSIDMEKRLIYGYTELEIAVPDNGIVGLHADNLVIENVTVDGEAAMFEVFPHYQHVDSENRWCSVSSTNSAADAAGSVYLSSLERELVPNLMIMCCNSAKSASEHNGRTNSENGVQSSGESKQNMKLVRIDYWVEKAETGIHFEDNVLHTDNQIRRARCWFPCMDESSQQCCYDLEFTVADGFVAASTGTLLYQVLSKGDPSHKTYVYRLNVPVAARWISLVVAPLEIFPDRHSGLLSHMCFPASLSKLRNTVGFFHNAFSHYEDYLSTAFPLGSYTQVFISPEMAVSSLSLGACMSIFSSQILFDEKVIDQTIETRIKLAYALARQWFGVYITAEEPNDDWLLEGLAGFLTDSFIKRFLGNNEARYRRYKANCAVCKADDSGATSLSSSASSRDLYGTQCIGLYGKIRSWKSVAVLQMLEKQMGPESFRKILQKIVLRAQDASHPLRTLSTKEFRQFANKVGNLERPFLKEFFPRWVGSCGCPVLKMGLSYNKRRNMVELAVLRGCTSTPDPNAAVVNGSLDSENRECGWPGMMSIRVHELDGMYDHPILPMAGETWQLLEIQCHSKLAAKRVQKPKKSSKPDGSDDNVDALPAVDTRSNAESPLLWLRADPEMEYLAEIHFNQPIQMWINQLEKDKDVVAQAQAIATLEAFPQLSFSVVNALNSFVSDSKAFWRIRIEAAFALANTASEETDWAGLLHLVTFYKSRRFDANIGLPKPNDFHDFAEYFVLEAIPHAIAMVRAADKKSPREAVEFILQLLKYNDNNGNPYSDVFWLAELVQSIGELEFGQQSILFLSSLLKRVDRLLQFDRLMPSYNGVLAISCIRTLTQIALKLAGFLSLDRVIELIVPFCISKTVWQVRIEATRALLDLEFHRKGVDAALKLFITYLKEEPSLRGQMKLGVHAVRLCQVRGGSDPESDVKSETLVELLRLLESPVAFNNVTLRHNLFCILQVLAGRPPTLFGVPRDESMRMGHAETCLELKNIFAALVKQSIPPPELPLDTVNVPYDGTDVLEEAPREGNTVPNIHEQTRPETDLPHDGCPLIPADPIQADTLSIGHEEDQPAVNLALVIPEVPREAEYHPAVNLPLVGPEAPREAEYQPAVNLPLVGPEALREPENQPAVNLPLVVSEAPREADTASNSHERRKPVVRIRVKRSAASSRAEDADNVTAEKSQGGHNIVDRGASSSVSVDAPERNFTEAASISNQNLEDVNSCHDVGSRVTASIGSAKVSDGDELVKELQCTADSSKVSVLSPSVGWSPPGDRIGKNKDVETGKHKYASLQSLCVPSSLAPENPRVHGKEEKKKKYKEKKRQREDRHKRDDPEYLERKRLKKEKKRKEKEMGKLMSGGPPSAEFQKKKEKSKSKTAMAIGDGKSNVIGMMQNKRNETGRGERKGNSTVLFMHGRKEESVSKVASVQQQEVKEGEASGSKVVIKKMMDSNIGNTANTSEGTSTTHKLRIKIKNRTTLNKS
ncbi:hypothetical protein LguiB_022632 [Lonicera macranthoides]